MSNGVEFEEIEIDKIVVGEQNIRKDLSNDDSLMSLALDMQRHGLLQPIGVSRSEEGYQLRWGLRRLSAARLLGWKTILARVITSEIDGIKAVALVENIHRSNLSVKEECDVVAYLYNAERKSINDIAASLSRSKAWVQQRLALPNFPPDIADALFNEEIPLTHAEELATIEDEAFRAWLISQYKTTKCSLREIRAYIHEFQKDQALQPAIEEAVERGVATAQNLVIYAECDRCKQRDDIKQLTFVRVHRNGCTKEEQDNGRTTDSLATTGSSAPR
jgi:ParB family chromosome partitioning protein